MKSSSESKAVNIFLSFAISAVEEMYAMEKARRRILMQQWKDSCALPRKKKKAVRKEIKFKLNLLEEYDLFHDFFDPTSDRCLW